MDVDGARGLIQDDDPRFLDDASGNGDTLSLAARELDAPVADPAVVSLEKATTIISKFNLRKIIIVKMFGLRVDSLLEDDR